MLTTGNLACEVNPNTYRGPAGDDENSPQSEGSNVLDCGPEGIFDCSGQCMLVTEYEEWLSDGYCDSAEHSLANLNCAEHNFDGGDCCASSCIDAAFTCGTNDFACTDPQACAQEEECGEEEEATPQPSIALRRVLFRPPSPPCLPRGVLIYYYHFLSWVYYKLFHIFILFSTY